jgi:hypothetical protein
MLVPYFLLFLCFRKATHEIFSELDETKAEPAIFLEHESGPKQRWRGPGPGHTLGRRGPGPGCATRGEPPGPLPSAAIPPIYSPRQDNWKDLINFPRNILQAAAVINARSRASRSSSRHPAGEGNHRRKPSSSPWSPPEWCVSSLPWTTGP